MPTRVWCWMVVVIYLAGCTTLTHQPYPGGRRIRSRPVWDEALEPRATFDTPFGAALSSRPTNDVPSRSSSARHVLRALRDRKR